MRRRPLRVLILGAGIAGPTLAGLLGRAGHSFAVVEGDQRVRSSGDPVDMRGSASDVVEELGLLSRLRDVASGVCELALVDAAGKRIAAIRTRRSGEREFDVAQANLSVALVGAARGEAGFGFGDTVVHIRSDGDRADVTFARSAAERWDLVVGAAHDTYFGAVSQVRTPTWSRGPVALLGDAASCVSLFGEGSTAAPVGAQTLARSVDTCGSSPPRCPVTTSASS